MIFRKTLTNAGINNVVIRLAFTQSGPDYRYCLARGPVEGRCQDNRADFGNLLTFDNLKLRPVMDFP